MRLLVVRIPNVGYCHEDFKGILVVWFTDTAFDISFDFCLPFLSMAGYMLSVNKQGLDNKDVRGESKILFVAPKH